MRIVFVAAHDSDHTRRWIRFFAERGHEAHVVTCGDSPVASEYAVHDLGPPHFGKIGYLFKIRRARRLIRSLTPDVVHAHHATSYGLLALCAGLHPLVVTCHGSDVLRSPRNPLLRLIVSRVLRAADLITVPAEHVKRAAVSLGGRDSEIAVFQYGVDTERLKELGRKARAHRPPEDTIRIVSARPLTPLYHTAAIVRAVALLRQRGDKCVYDVAGDGPERTALEHLATELDVSDRVTFHGRLPEGETMELLARADVYVSVAESDGVSIALLEAMALGLLPVVSDIEANRNWVESGVNGVTASIDAASIAGAIQSSLRLDRDQARRHNADLVLARADRSANLSACEALLVDLVASTR